MGSTAQLRLRPSTDLLTQFFRLGNLKYIQYSCVSKRRLVPKSLVECSCRIVRSCPKIKKEEPHRRIISESSGAVPLPLRRYYSGSSSRSPSICSAETGKTSVSFCVGQPVSRFCGTGAQSSNLSFKRLSFVMPSFFVNSSNSNVPLKKIKSPLLNYTLQAAAPCSPMPTRQQTVCAAANRSRHTRLRKSGHRVRPWRCAAIPGLA